MTPYYEQDWKRMPLTVGSLFSGIGGFDLGFERAGFRTIWRCETEPFCRRILTEKMGGSPIHGDVRELNASDVEHPDILIGGFPCQDLSVAGLGKGFDGVRSSLFFQFARLIDELKPKLWVMENVPGFFRSPRRFPGKDFAIALAVLDRGGTVGGWRVLDSQYFGLAQRRARVFLVGGPRGFGDRAQEVLFESESGAWNSQASDEAGARVAATLRGRSARAGVNEPGRGGEDDENLIEVAAPITAGYAKVSGVNDGPRGKPQNLIVARPLKSGGNDRHDESHETYIAATLNCGGNDGGFRTEPGEHLIEVGERARALTGSMFKRHDEDTDTLIPIAGTLGAEHGRNRGLGNANEDSFLIAAPITASAGHHGHSSDRGDGHSLVWALGSHVGTDGDVSNRSHMTGGPVGSNISEEMAHVLRSGRTQSIGGQQSGVRRLTPLECERLQGFPDGWTCLCGDGHRGSSFCSCTDTPRYKALGNAVSVPVAEWIAKRILAAVSPGRVV